MLSTGKFHVRVPRDPVKLLKFRLFLLRRCREEPKFRKAVLHACEQDFLFFVLVFVNQYNPKPSGERTKEVGPFIPWDFQDKAVLSQDPAEPGILWCMEHGEDLVIEKSRDMGASWLCLLVMLWLILFHKWKKFTLISKDADAVDKPGEKDSLMWKLDFVLSFIPEWITGPMNRVKYLLESKRTGSVISGYASKGTSGVGGRATAVFADEFSLIQEARQLYGNTKDVTNCRIFNGTHYGTAGMFFELCDSSSVIGSRIKKLQMHWSKHPDKGAGLYVWDTHTNLPKCLDPNYPYPHDYPYVSDGTPAGGPKPGIRSPWYDKECLVRSKRDIPLHLDMDPKGSSNQFFDPVTIAELRRQYSRDPEGRYDIQYDDVTGRPLKVANGNALVRTPKGHLHLWCPLDWQGNPPRDIYGIGCDPSAGVGATPSVASIMNSKGEKVGQYFNAHIKPSQFGVLIVALAWIFNNEEGTGAKLVWECRGPGALVTLEVIRVGYRNIYYRPSSPFALSSSPTDMPGWDPTDANTRVLLENYRNALQNRLVLNPCDSALSTCNDFVWKNNTIEHDRKRANPDESGARENHGDEVIADAQAWMMIKEYATKPELAEEKKPEYGSREWLKQYQRRHQKPQGVWS